MGVGRGEICPVDDASSSPSTEKNLLSFAFRGADLDEVRLSLKVAAGAVGGRMEMAGMGSGGGGGSGGGVGSRAGVGSGSTTGGVGSSSTAGGR